MIKLYFSPGACSIASHVILEELQIPYEAIKVDLKTYTYDSEDYYKINPLGAVPALMLDDGTVITQNAAVLFYLGDLDPKHHLIPKAGTMERVRAHEWLSFINSDLHKAFSPLFKLDSYVSSENAKEELKQGVTANIKKIITIVEKKLPEKGFVLGENFSVIDAYLLVFFFWGKHLNIPFDSWPKYSALTKRILARPSVEHVLKQEKLG